MKTLGPWMYQASDRLGGGGFSDVYRCHRPRAPDAHFAIKVFKNPKYVKTLQRELNALDTLQGCPGVPQVMDHGRDDSGQLCLVTDLLPGVRLDKRVKQQGPLDEQAVLAMARQILNILEVAHGKDLLHKDITPGNILLNGTQASLIDWGVSEPVGDGSAPHIRSKREYCAPEYFYYKHCKASDFYSLAWVMVFALTGRQPYHFDEEKDKDYRVVAHCLERPEFGPNIPSRLQAMLCNWASKSADGRVTHYLLDELIVKGPALGHDLLTAKDFRQLRHAQGWKKWAEIQTSIA